MFVINRQKPAGAFGQNVKEGWVMVDENTKDMINVQMNVTVELPRGIGVSLVNNIPEELIYMLFRGVSVQLTTDSNQLIFKLKVQNFQVWDKYKNLFLYRN